MLNYGQRLNMAQKMVRVRDKMDLRAEYRGTYNGNVEYSVYRDVMSFIITELANNTLDKKVYQKWMLITNDIWRQVRDKK